MEPEIQTKTKLVKYTDPNPRKHFHWAVLVALSLAVAAGLLIAIENFKTTENIDSIFIIPSNSKILSPEEVLKRFADNLEKGDLESAKRWLTPKISNYDKLIGIPEDGRSLLIKAIREAKVTSIREDWDIVRFYTSSVVRSDGRTIEATFKLTRDYGGKRLIDIF